MQFYQMAAVQVHNAGAGQMMLQLAAMEANHERIFADMRKRLAGRQKPLEIDQGSDTANYLRGLLAGKFFDIRTTPAQVFQCSDSVREILLTAIGLEKETLVFYEGVRRVVAEEDRPAVEAVLREEMKHISQLAGAL
jgi:rubrerythrin